MSEAEITAWTDEWIDPPMPGQVYRDQIGGAVILVLTTPSWPGVLRCRGVQMVSAQPFACSYRARASFNLGLMAGRRYRDPASGLEVRCLRSGPGYLTYRGHPLFETAA